MEIKDNFERRWDCEIEEHSDLAPIKEANTNGDLNKLGSAVGEVQNNHSVEERIKSGKWMFRVFWNDNVERVQIACYGYKAGITYEGELE